MQLVKHLWNQLLQNQDSRDYQISGKWVLLALLLGISVGCVAIVFDHLSLLISTVFLKGLAGFNPGEAAGEYNPYRALIEKASTMTPWLILLVLAVGGMISGWIVNRFSPEAAGPGTGAAVGAFHQKRGYLRADLIWVKTIASAITLGTGGSAGREGPIAQIGAAIGSTAAHRFKLTARDRRILLAAGMGAGVGTIFRAPLAGALFAAEILYREADFEAEVIVPAAMASIISYGVYSLSLPIEYRYMPMFGENLRFHMGSPFELLPYTLLALTLVGMGVLFITFFERIRQFFDHLKISFWARVSLGATLSGLIALALFWHFDDDVSILGVMGTGYGTLQEALTGERPFAISILLAIAFGKMVTSSLTVGSGGSGGLFGPAMVIGGCTGLAVAQFLQPLLPQGLIHSPQAFGVVGMAGFFAGCANAPISTIIMVSEFTGEYKLLIPTMWVSTICFLLMRRFNLYRQQVPSRLESPAHRGDFIVDVLEGIKVEEVYRSDAQLKLIPESMPLEQIVHILPETQQHYFPVVDAKGRLVGIFSSDDVRSYLYNEAIWHLANAGDVMTNNPATVTPKDNLNTALRYFTSKNIDELPVVSPSDPGRVIGMVGRKETISCYNSRLIDLKKRYDDEDSVLIPPA